MYITTPSSNLEHEREHRGENIFMENAEVAFPKPKTSAPNFRLFCGCSFYFCAWLARRVAAFIHTLFGIDDLGASAGGFSDTNGAFAGVAVGGVIFNFTRFVGLEGSGDFVVTRHNLTFGLLGHLSQAPFGSRNMRRGTGKKKRRV